MILYNILWSTFPFLILDLTAGFSFQTKLYSCEKCHKNWHSSNPNKPKSLKLMISSLEDHLCMATQSYLYWCILEFICNYT